jgi:CRP-like cAMP-binding protein
MLVARWITLPIQRLTRAACHIEGETFTPDILDPVTRRGDELGRLARIVQAMGQVVMSRQQSLQQQLQQLKQENAQQSLRNAQLTSLGNVSVWHSLIGQSRALRNAMAIAHRAPLSERLKAVTYFADFTLEQRQRLLEFGEERWVDSGTDICTLGERGNELYFLLDGEAAMLTEDEPPRYLTTIDAGEVVGEFSLLLDIPRVATIQAIAPSTLFAMNREGLRQLLTEYPHLEDSILDTLQQRQAERQMLFQTLTVIQDPTIEQPSQNYLEWLRDRLKHLIAGK